MPTAAKIPESLIATHITRAMADVFKTMLTRDIALVESERGHDATPWPPLPARAHPEVPLVAGMVGFLGEVDGFVYIYMDQAYANDCAARMLGMTAKEAAALTVADMKDAIGELTNMLVGSFKNALCDLGFFCKLTIPSILVGCDFAVVPTSSSERYIFVFNCGGHRVVADILMKSDE